MKKELYENNKKFTKEFVDKWNTTNAETIEKGDIAELKVKQYLERTGWIINDVSNMYLQYDFIVSKDCFELKIDVKHLTDFEKYHNFFVEIWDCVGKTKGWLYHNEIDFIFTVCNNKGYVYKLSEMKEYVEMYITSIPAKSNINKQNRKWTCVMVDMNDYMKKGYNVKIIDL